MSQTNKPKRKRTTAEQVLNGLNKGLIADTLGGPVDLVTMALNAPGMAYGAIKGQPAPYEIKKPVLGSDFFTDLMQRGGMAYDDGEATGLLEDVVRLGSGILGPGGVAKGVQKAPEIARATAKGTRALGEKAAGMTEDYMVKQGMRPSIFIGENAKTWDKARADKAVDLEKRGANPQDLWDLTRTFRGPDGKLRQEIDDSKAKLLGKDELRAKADALKGRNAEIRQQIADSKAYPDLFPKELTAAQRALREEAKANKGLLDDPVGLTADPKTLGNRASIAFDHPALFEAYPGLADNILRQGVEMGDGVLGAFNGGNVDISRFGMTKDPRNTMLHEMQHAVQGVEGFTPGANPSVMKPEHFDPKFVERMDAAREAGPEGFQNFYRARREGAFDAYQRVGGEAEARAVEARRDFGPAQRQGVFPLDSYDVPLDRLILDNFPGGPQASMFGGMKSGAPATGPATAPPMRISPKMQELLAAKPVQPSLLDEPPLLPSSEGPADAVALRGYHYGNKPNLPVLSGRMYGSGARGQEAERLSMANDPRVKQRVYFYGEQGGMIPRPEPVVMGPHVYQSDLNGLYLPGKSDPNVLKDARTAGRFDANAFEGLLLEGGYNGYFNPDYNQAVLLGRDAPVQYLGNRYDLRDRIKK
jgi:hypothetical protein